MRKYYSGITVFKFIGALLVLFGHTNTPDFYKRLAFAITGFEQFLWLVVPCFYIIAGFLAYNGWSNAENPDKYVKRYLAWILGLYLFIFGIHVVTKFIPDITKIGTSYPQIINRCGLLLKTLFVRGPFKSFWFIPPLIFGIAVSFYLERRNKVRALTAIIVIGFFASLLINGTLRSVCQFVIGNDAIVFIDSVDVCKRLITNYLGHGATFVLLGVLLAKYEASFININSKTIAVLTIVFTVAEMLFLKYFIGGLFPHNLVISVFPLSIWLFYGLLKIKSENVKRHHKEINTLSIVLYFSHAMLIHINLAALGWGLSTLSLYHTITCIILTLSEGVMITALIFFFKKRRLTALQPSLINSES